MLKNLINKYEQDSPFSLMQDYESDYVDYLKSLQSDTKKIAFLEARLNTPELTQKEISKKVGVTPKTICEWQKDSLFIRTLIELSESKYRLKRTEIIEVLFSKAKEGDYKAIQIFLKYTDSKR